MDPALLPLTVRAGVLPVYLGGGCGEYVLGGVREPDHPVDRIPLVEL